MQPGLLTPSFMTPRSYRRPGYESARPGFGNRSALEAGIAANLLKQVQKDSQFVLIGRGNDTDPGTGKIMIPQGETYLFVSQKHCLIRGFRDPKTAAFYYEVIDGGFAKGSSNGTYINGKKVDTTYTQVFDSPHSRRPGLQGVIARPGDALRIGRGTDTGEFLTVILPDPGVSAELPQPASSASTQLLSQPSETSAPLKTEFTLDPVCQKATIQIRGVAVPYMTIDPARLKTLGDIERFIAQAIQVGITPRTRQIVIGYEPYNHDLFKYNPNTDWNLLIHVPEVPGVLQALKTNQCAVQLSYSPEKGSAYNSFFDQNRPAGQAGSHIRPGYKMTVGDKLQVILPNISHTAQK